jgi:hypothetical protein
VKSESPNLGCLEIFSRNLNYKDTKIDLGNLGFYFVIYL